MRETNQKAFSVGFLALSAALFVSAFVLGTSPKSVPVVAGATMSSVTSSRLVMTESSSKLASNPGTALAPLQIEGPANGSTIITFGDSGTSTTLTASTTYRVGVTCLGSPTGNEPVCIVGSLK